MDDTRKPDRIHSEDDEPVREGDVLGLGGIDVPKTPADPTTEFDDESRARRRARAAGEDDLTSDTGVTRTPGATGIDMGSGGSGTDVE
jgi:hypothetical protein